MTDELKEAIKKFNLKDLSVYNFSHYDLRDFFTKAYINDELRDECYIYLNEHGCLKVCWDVAELEQDDSNGDITYVTYCYPPNLDEYNLYEALIYENLDDDEIFEMEKYIRKHFKKYGHLLEGKKHLETWDVNSVTVYELEEICRKVLPQRCKDDLDYYIEMSLDCILEVFEYHLYNMMELLKKEVNNNEY